jgi:hypothetical protein
VGGNFTREDVLEAGREIGEDLELWLDTWIEGTELPGFVITDVRAERVADSEEGSPRYQTLITIVNEEETPGLLRVDYRAGDGDDQERGSSDPIRVPGRTAMEIGVVSSKTPRSMRVYPYLALNREMFNVPLPPIDEDRLSDAEPFKGGREVAWIPPRDESIVVDDLDEGFEVVEAASRGFLRFGGSGPTDEVLDRGLPVNQPQQGTPSRWSRRSVTYAWGKYRHTMALVRAGSGEREAIFTAEIPQPGEWELEFHLPKRPSDQDSRRGPNGTWNLSVVDPSGDRSVTFDARDGEPGWNSLGRFDLEPGEVRVKLSDETDGRYVIADAIRWTPARSEVARSRLQ